MRTNWLVWAFLPFGLAVGCSGDEEPQEIQPESRGQRGESCQARNDCQSGLACISGTCSKNDFEIAPSAKHCDQVDCQETVDCCAGRPIELPAKCDDFASICTTSSIPNCVSSTCTSDATCGGGTCSTGTCSVYGGACETADDCANTCEDDGTGSLFCTASGGTCIDDLDCVTQSCSSRFCDCANPDYDPSHPLCTDPDCLEEPCTQRCVEERCVADTSCETATDCYPLDLSYCDDGRCVGCLEDADCDEDLEEACVDGTCKKPCTQNEECPFFWQCQDGDCVETGCTSDRECVLAAGRGLFAAEDGRLAKCLPSDADPNINACKVPCENDGACGSEFEICEAGYCKFVGCETDEECRPYLGLDKDTTESLPYTPRAICRE